MGSSNFFRHRTHCRTAVPSYDSRHKDGTFNRSKVQARPRTVPRMDTSASVSPNSSPVRSPDNERPSAVMSAIFGVNTSMVILCSVTLAPPPVPSKSPITFRYRSSAKLMMGDMPSPLDGHCQFTLMAHAIPGNAARNDPPPLRQKIPQEAPASLKSIGAFSNRIGKDAFAETTDPRPLRCRFDPSLASSCFSVH